MRHIPTVLASPRCHMVPSVGATTHQVTPDVSWTSPIEGHEGGPGAKHATRERHKGCVLEVCRSALRVKFGGRSDRGGRDLRKM